MRQPWALPVLKVASLTLGLIAFPILCTSVPTWAASLHTYTLSIFGISSYVLVFRCTSSASAASICRSFASMCSIMRSLSARACCIASWDCSILRLVYTNMTSSIAM